MTQRNRSSLVEEVCEDLARQIRQAPPGEERWLPTTQELATRYGVSRTVLREAISRLESQGLIEVRHGVGLRAVNHLHKPVAASVQLLLPDQSERLHQAMEARLLLEAEIARLAATRIDDDGIARLVEAQRCLIEADSIDDAVQADLDFHHVLADYCDNAVLSLLLDSIAELGRESRKLTIHRAGAAQAHRTHNDVLQAMIARDGKAAAAAMRMHLQSARSDLANQIAGEPRTQPGAQSS